MSTEAAQTEVPNAAASMEATPDVAPAATPTENPTASEQSSWYGTIESEDLKAWADNKNFATPYDALSSYQQLEKYMGADKAGRGVIIPKDGSSDEEWSQFYGKIGRPDDAGGYDLPIPEGSGDDFANAMSQIMFDSGVPKGAAQKLAEGWNEYNVKMAEEVQKQQDAQLVQQEQSLRTEWGGAYDKNVSIAKNAAKEFGISGDQIDALQGALGFDGVMKLFSDMGNKIADDSFIGGDTNVNAALDAMTPARATQEMENFKADPQNAAKMAAGDAATIQKFNNITKYLP
jgi:hypothetical protein